MYTLSRPFSSRLVLYEIESPRSSTKHLRQFCCKQTRLSDLLTILSYLLCLCDWSGDLHAVNTQHTIDNRATFATWHTQQAAPLPRRAQRVRRA